MSAGFRRNEILYEIGTGLKHAKDQTVAIEQIVSAVAGMQDWGISNNTIEGAVRGLLADGKQMRIDICGEPASPEESADAGVFELPTFFGLWATLGEVPTH